MIQAVFGLSGRGLRALPAALLAAVVVCGPAWADEPKKAADAAQDFAQGAQSAGAVCTIPAQDDDATWICETSGSGCAVTNATRFTIGSAEYKSMVYQTFHMAGLAALQYAQTHRPGTWVVAVDIDETIVSNAPYTYERERCGRGYTRESWADWTAAEAATPLPGAKSFLDLVYSQGGLVVGVTNRREAEAEATQAVLDRHDLPMEFVLYRGDAKDATGEKEPRWERVPSLLADQGYPNAQIVMWMGDQITDFPDLDQKVRERAPDFHGPFGVRYFVLPNPMYGEWEHVGLK